MRETMSEVGKCDIVRANCHCIGPHARNLSKSEPKHQTSALCGRSSVVERQLPKLYVVGSIPIARSNLQFSVIADVIGWRVQIAGE